DDLNNLLSKVQDELKTKAQGQISSQSGGDILVITTPVDTNLTEKKFDRKVGDQVSTVNLSAKETFTFGTYKKSDGEALLSDAAKNDVPSGFSLASDKSQFTVKDASVDKDGNIKATLSGSAMYQGQLDTSDFAKKYAGNQHKLFS